MNKNCQAMVPFVANAQCLHTSVEEPSVTKLIIKLNTCLFPRPYAKEWRERPSNTKVINTSLIPSLLVRPIHRILLGGIAQGTFAKPIARILVGSVSL